MEKLPVKPCVTPCFLSLFEHRTLFLWNSYEPPRNRRVLKLVLGAAAQEPKGLRCELASPSADQCHCLWKAHSPLASCRFGPQGPDSV